MICLDLQQGNIKLGTLLDEPKSRAVLEKRFGAYLNNPLVATARNLTLKQLVQMAGSHLSKETIEATLTELRKV